jgi:hypothetical protein
MPGYLEYFSIAKSLDYLGAEPYLAKKTDAEIRKMIRRRFEINSVSGLNPSKVIIERRGGALIIKADYEVRTTLIANIDLITHFDKEVRIEAH